MRFDSNLSRRQVLKMTSAGVVAGQAGLAGCSGNQQTQATPEEQTSTSTKQKTTEAQKTIELAWSHYPIIPDALPGIISIEKGFYQDHGIKISEVTSFSGGGTTVRGLTTGGLPVGSGAAASVVKGWLAGAPIHMIANDVAPPAIDVLTLPDSNIGSIQDLKGKSVAYSNPGSTSQAMLILSIKRADGISLDDVELKAVGGLGESLTAIQEGAVDAGWSNIIVSIPKMNNNDLKRVYGTWEYAKEVPSEVIMTGNRTIRKKPELLRGIINSHSKANEYISNNVEDTAQIWADTADNITKELGVQVINETLEINENYYSVHFPDGAFSSIEEMLRAQGAIDQKPNWDKIVVDKFLP